MANIEQLIYFLSAMDIVKECQIKKTIMNNNERIFLLEGAARRIRAERKKLNMSMEQLAELSNVSLQTIKDIEHAKRACQIDTLVSIASALHLTTDYVLGMLDYTVEDTPSFESIYSVLNDTQKEFLREMAKLIVVML